MKYAASLGWGAVLIAAAGFLAAVLVLAYLAGPVDRYRKWRKRRALHINARDLARFNMTAFRGTRKSTWLS